MARKLKVFSADLGFVRAVVAAPSRKAALEAWGVRDDLFTRGSAREITDDAASDGRGHRGPGRCAPQAHRVRSRLCGGGEGQGLRPKGKPAAKTVKPKPATPAPSRDAVDAAEAGVRAAQAERDASAETFDEEQAALDRRRDRALSKVGQVVAEREAALKRARTAYDRALKAWNG